jgi:hypothetical protein
MTEPLKLVVGRPRRAGNSATLAKAVQRGAEAAGTQVSLRFVDDFISSFLRDCRSCRLPGGECSIPDQFRTLFRRFHPSPWRHLLLASLLVRFVRPDAAFFDRTFCYYAA